MMIEFALGDKFFGMPKFLPLLIYFVKSILVVSVKMLSYPKRNFAYKIKQ